MSADSAVAAEAALLALARVLAPLVAEAVVRELRNGPADLISQAISPLGKRRHCAAVRARVARGDSGGCIVGRTHYLTPTALQEELQRKPAKARAVKVRALKVTPRDPLADLSNELGLELTG